MPGLELSSRKWQATVRVVTALSCACVVAARIEHPANWRLPHGGRTAMGLIASASQRGATKRGPMMRTMRNQA